jgi:hypothetical protein
MKKITHGKLTLRSLTIQNLSHVSGGATAQRFPRETAQPSVCNVSCLPPKSDGCYTDGCPTETQGL